MLQKLSVVAVLLLGIGAGMLVYQQSNAPASHSEKLLASFDPGSLKSLEIQEGEERVEIREVDGIWKTFPSGYRADTKKVQEFLLKLMETPLGSIVTDNPKKHHVFQLLHAKDNEGKWEVGKTGTLVMLKDRKDQTALSLLLGKKRLGVSNRTDGQYIRLTEQPNVYLIAEHFNAKANASEWTDKVILDIDGTKLAKRIRLAHPNESSLIFYRENAESDWAIGGDSKKVKQAEVQNLSRTINHLTFVEALERSSLSEQDLGPSSTFEIELFDGRTVELLIGNQEVSEEKKHYARVKITLDESVDNPELVKEVEAFNAYSKDWVYVLNSWIGQRFFKTKDDLVSISTQ